MGADLPQSDAIFLKAYLAETAEAFCDGHVAAFDFFGGVPQSLLYDNTRLAVSRPPAFFRLRMIHRIMRSFHGRLQKPRRRDAGAERDVLDAAVPLPVQGSLRSARTGK